MPQEIALIEELPPHPVVMDVGANVGAFAAAVLERRPEAKLFAFEAQETARREFAARHPQIPVWGALGARHERRMLFSDAPASELGTFYPRPAMPMIVERPLGEVTVWSLADLWDEFGVETVDLLKIDTEGAELEILRGAAPLVHRFSTITWEFITGPTAYVEQTLTDFHELLPDFTIEKMSEDHDGLAIIVARNER